MFKRKWENWEEKIGDMRSLARKIGATFEIKEFRDGNVVAIVELRQPRGERNGNNERDMRGTDPQAQMV
ncbi:MAG: hypothetical protein WC810_02910 [Janthinobacterium sp.]|jgi:hypothetical protein